MKWIILFLSSALVAQSPPVKSGETTIKGIPRLVRTNPVPEVFFYDIPSGYVIPENGSFNRIMNAIQNGIKTRTAVGFRVDPKTKNILGVEGEAKSETPATLPVDDGWAPPPADKKPANEAKPDSKKKPVWEDL